MKKRNIAIFASGNGTNALRLIEYFKNHREVAVGLVVCNSNKAGVIDVARQHNVPVSIINKTLLANNGFMTSLLKLYDIDFIVLAGFLLLVPPFLIKAFDRKMINIHPALLPRHGGKGMFGLAVHQQVIDEKDAETGITIHYVNEVYDQGKVVFQARCPVEKKESAEKLQKKVQELEHKHLPEWTEKLVLQTRFL
ncbi:MAG: phosphoribosylglycinamide formyltransferase [Saprospiraceae bacterium]|nr:phosphoribosylglycinamide formyltransferase [Saprospiraceae bacterium]MBP9210265.1 phosphoribosylglycinamide formyltransferase [Saprospiraceae bacterium]MBV6473781.1 Phosphoribosylglycinamide formyltransferase [Saprospiraceae bacterium]